MELIKSQEEKIRKRVIVLCLVSWIGLYFSITNHSIAIVVFVINLASLLFLNKQEIFCELMFLLPFTMIYKLNPASTSLFTYLTLVTAIRLLVAKPKISMTHLSMLFFVAFYFLLRMGTAFTDYIKLISNLLLLECFTLFVKRENFSKIILSLAFGIIASSIIGLRKTTWPALSAFFSSMKAEYINGEEVARFTGLYLDPNYYSIIVIICIFGILLFTYLKEINGKLGMAIVITIIIFGFMTYSRSLYLCFAAVLIFICFIRIRGKKYVSTIFAIILFLIVGIYYATESGIIENILYRFQAEDISNNRFSIWGEYLEEISNNSMILFFGTGLDGGYLNNHGAHNFYIESIYYIGIIGTLLYYTICIMLQMNTSDHMFSRSILNYSLTVILLALFAALGMLFQFDFVYILMINWIVLNTDMSKIKTRG